MVKKKLESLALEDLGNLDALRQDELMWLREKLIADVDRIHHESAQVAQRVKELGQQKHALQQELAARARALRAVKHTLRQSDPWQEEADEPPSRQPLVVHARRGRATHVAR
jgi:hypothetical protein